MVVIYSRYYPYTGIPSVRWGGIQNERRCFSAKKTRTYIGAAYGPTDTCSIEIDNVRFSYGSSQGRQILDGASLNVDKGSFHMLLGLNGCGKSTLLKCIGGLERPTSGDIRVLHDENDPERQHYIGYVFQNPDNQVVYPSVYSDVACSLGRFPKDVITERDVRVVVEYALERVGMLECKDRQVSTLSGGQKQRVAIAGALVENPKILLLDELTTFLDGTDQMNVVKSVRDIVTYDRSITALWVTHRLEELDFADAVSYMENGKVMWTVHSPGEAKRRMRHMGAFIS
jgi:energy-coupling factor transport system ATP-binding protein